MGLYFFTHILQTEFVMVDEAANIKYKSTCLSKLLCLHFYLHLNFFIATGWWWFYIKQPSNI